MSEGLTQRISDCQARFESSLDALREQTHRWTLRPRSPEAKVLDGLMILMEMNNLHQALLLKDREHSEAAHRVLFQEAETRMEQCVAKCESLLDQCTRSATEEVIEVRRALHEGVAASRQLQKIDEKTVKAKVAEVLGTVKAEIAESMKAQIVMAGTRVRRDEISKRAGWFATMIVGGTVFGIILDHLI